MVEIIVGCVAIVILSALGMPWWAILILGAVMMKS